MNREGDLGSSRLNYLACLDKLMVVDDVRVEPVRSQGNFGDFDQAEAIVFDDAAQ